MGPEQFECSLCLGERKFNATKIAIKNISETFKPPIKITNCGHNYCEDCLIKHVDGRKTWICPLSRKEHDRSVSSLPRNYLIEQLVESMTTPPPQPASNPESRPQVPKLESCSTHDRPNELRKNRGSYTVHPYDDSPYDMAHI